MAEFKLGRIRFVWKNDWASGTIYYKDDVVAYGGKMYICVVGHTSSPDFFTDFDIVPPKWNIASDGQQYRDEWSTDTFYTEDNVVKYGARLYICQTTHTSAETEEEGLEADQANWSVFAEGLDYKGEWQTETRYRVNDTVKYGGFTYRCTALHTSASTDSAGLEADQGSWQIMNAGIEYKSEWMPAVRYKLNDVVNYGASLWICTTQHTSTASFGNDDSNWEQFVQGFQFEDEWMPGKIYQVGDVVKSGGNQYIAESNHTGVDPQTDDGTNWTLFTQGLKFLGEYNEDSSQVEYNAGELVSRGGYLYVSKQKGTGNDPTDTEYWHQLSTGLRWRGVWLDDQEYVLGDVVRFGDNSYVCVQGHISEGDDFSTETLTDPGGGAENSRPDVDLTGTYWNVLVIGSETSVLNTDGDLVFYSGNGPTRLPIGKEGQLLRVSDQNLPEWTYYGVADDVYYVAEHGTDLPAPLHGRTLDKPFRSIRYATEQVQKGTKNPNARRLLELNKFFIQRETVEWVDYQIANAGVGDLFENFTYAESKCERDMGYIVDAIIWDITHGGNVETRKVALEYVNNSPEFYTLGQEAETNAAIEYALTLMQSILANAAPDVSYQATNGDNSTAIVDQYFDQSLEVEDVFSEITSLISIVTDAITEGTDTNIPDRIIRNTLIKVSTGRYYEMLPIIVPAECCILGDELRSTNVQPRKASNTTLVDIFDSQFSYEALSRIEDIIGDVVKGVTVTGTTGNTETQYQEFPLGDIAEGVAATQAIRTIKTEIDFGLGQKLDAFPLPNPPSFDNEYGYARDLIRVNKDFIQAEIIAYITNNYPDVKYSKTKCKQDIGYILDALSYDLTYGGNWQSTNAGRAYFAGQSGALQIDSEERQATLAAYAYLKDILAPISRNITVNPTEQAVTNQISGEAGSTNAASDLETLMDRIINIITNNSNPSITYPDISGVSAPLQSDHAALINASNLTTVKDDTITFISNNFPNLTYDSDKCKRDIELIAYAAAYDAAFGTNFATMVAAFAYRRTSSNKVYGEQSEATIAANLYAASQLKAYTSQASMDDAIDTAYQYANDIIFGGTTNEGRNKAIALQNNHHAVRLLELNKDFIKAEVHAWMSEYFKGEVTETNGSTDVLTVDDTSWMSKNMPIRFENLEDSTGSTGNSGVATSVTYYVRNILSDTQFTISSEENGSLLSIDTNEGNFTVYALYNYDLATCNRDVDAYIDAVKHDLVYPRDYKREYTDGITTFLPSNYKSKLAARYYVNSVLGCQEEDFFYLRNGTGLRLMTLDGLQGDLGPTNEYGTRRPTAGAYASLDPGWGPLHQDVWITARSPYVQNVSTFGFAATGQRIDGALHDGGNDSIVSNDFTQVISDGIGAHILNNGRAELVSVFTYYSHIGYLAENGGRIRATNGNNSYGTFGSVAEGVDEFEIPATGIVDNKFQYNATIGNVFCDGDQILALEYSHAGNEYTEAELNIFGAGQNEDLSFTDRDFRDDAVFECRVTELNDSTGLAGGTEYLIVQNTAQAGSTTSLTLAATDGNLDTTYPGMKVVITGGAGVGQYAIVDSYNAGTKVAGVIKESDGTSGWDHILEGKEIVSPNASSTYQIEPNVSFTAPPRSATQHSVTSTTFSDLIYHPTTAQYTSVATTGGNGSGATFDVDKVGSKYYITINAIGSSYERLDELTIDGALVGGQTSTNDITVTLTTVDDDGAVVEFDFEGVAQKGIFLAFATASNTYRTSIDGSTYSTGTLPASIGGVPRGGIATGSIDDGSTLFEPSYVIVAEASGNAFASSEDGVNWTGGTFATGTADSRIAFGDNVFMRIASDTTDVYTTVDGGTVWNVVGSLPSTGADYLAFGQGLWWVVYSGTTNAYYSNDNGQNWTLSTLPSTNAWNKIIYGDNKLIISDGTDYVKTIDQGQNWTSHSYPAAIDDITYGNGVFVATSAATNDRVYHTDDGYTWDTYTPTLGSTTQLGSITFGNPNQTGVFLAAGDGTTTLMHKFSLGATARGRVGVANGRIFEVRLWEPGSGYTTAPDITITDPSNINDATFDVRIGKGQLAQPSFVNRGSGFETADADINDDLSNGFADFFQTGDFVAIRQLTYRPTPGSNVVFDSLPDQVFKLVNTVSFVGTSDGSYTTFLQLSPQVSISDAPIHGDGVTMRIRFSQVRLTGHDFLDIGTGNFTDTNYPGTPVNAPDQDAETQEADGGRVFFTATDQDGNFRVGELFSVEQSTGIATLNAEAFNIAGLQELTLGEVTLGGNSAAVSEFSTDPFFTANSDNVVPTQRAIKAYIEAQIGGGGASLNVNSVTAGDIFINTNQITTVSGELINIKARVNFQGGILGLPLAYNYMLR